MTINLRPTLEHVPDLPEVERNFNALQAALNALGIYVGTGSPETVVTAPVSSIYRRLDGGANTSVYFKETGTAATGWVGK